MKSESPGLASRARDEDLIGQDHLYGIARHGHTSSNLAEAAKPYAAHGIKVLSCWWRDFGRDEAKAPIGKLVPNGFLDATTNIGTIEYWWRVQPKALIGGVVPDDAVILDLDPHNCAATEEDLQHIRDSMTIPDVVIDGINYRGGFTPREDLDLRDIYLETELIRRAGMDGGIECHCVSGRGNGGFHAYFKRPPGELSGKRLPPGVDLKDGGKGYTIFPPSPHPDTGRPYRWINDPYPLQPMSDPLLALLRPHPGTSDWEGHGRPSQIQLEGILRKVTGAINGERNSLLYWGACRLTENSYPKEAFNALYMAGIHTGLADREVVKTIRSANHALGGAL
jgi:hypothetical protein